MKIIETERLYLREFTETDLERLYEIYSDAKVMKYIGKGEALSEEQTRKIINAWTKKYYKQYGFGIWALINKENDTLIGHCGFNWLQDNSDIEIAYLLSKEYWGKGMATEISKATLQYGFDSLNLKRIIALSYPENYSSIRVIEKLGMKPQGLKTLFGVKFLFFVSENNNKH
jgi:ribosomal-protein-alanine N-acetyltransferase